MSSNLHPGADYSDFDDHDWQECDDCGGDGLDETMCQCETIEDICCCATPTPVRCQTCGGKGGWHIDHSAEDQAAYEAENDTR